MTAKRIIIKVGSSTLTGDAGTSLNGSAVTKLVDVVADLKGKGKEVIIVTSAAISAGMAPLGLTERPTDLATQQASASVGQGLLIAKYSAEFTRHKIVASQVLVTGDDLSRDLHKENVKRTLNLVSDVDALYDAPPSQVGANRIAKVTNFADLADIEIGGVGSSGVGSGGMVTKIQAAEIATSSGASMLLTDLAHLGDALSGKDVGPLFTSK